MENQKFSYDDCGNYHDDDVRLNNYGELADIQPNVDETLVNTVVNQIQSEVGVQLRNNPRMTTNEIKIQAMHRFMDLIEKQLLTTKEADRCYQRFVQMVDFYYGI